MRAGLLSQPEVIQKLNERFVCTTITIFDLWNRAKSGDELAKNVETHWSNPVSLMFFKPNGEFVTLLSPTKELIDVHPDTARRPTQTRCPGPEHNTQLFLKEIEESFGKKE